MMRIVIFVLFLSTILGAIWLSLENESNFIMIELLGYHVEISIVLAIILLVIIFIILCFLIYFLIFLKNIPNSLKKHYQAKHNHQDLLLLLNGFASLYKDDLSKVRYTLKKLVSHKDDYQLQLLKPLVSLLTAQCNYLHYKENPNYNEALEDSYSDLLKYEEMRMVGFKGLITLRMHNNRYYDALIYAEKAFALEPKLHWLLVDLIKIYTELGIYDKADYIINKALSYKFIDKNEANSLLVKNFFADANYSIANSEMDKAISLLEEELKIDPDYYDAMLALIGLYQNNSKAIYKTIEKAWKVKPSMDIARLMLTKFTHETLNKKVKLIEGLIDLDSDIKEGYLVLTELYIEEKMLDQAKNTMDRLLALHAPDSDMSRLMALIEAKSNGDHNVIANWLNKL